MALQPETAISTSLKKKRNWFYAGFIAINLFLSCYYLDIWITPNTCARAIPVLTLYEDKTLVIDKYANFAVDVSKVHGHYYSIKAPLTTYMVYPFYWIYEKVGLPDISDTTLKKYPIYIFEDTKANLDGRAKLLPKSAAILFIGDILCGVIPFILILVLSLFAIKQITTNVSPVLLVMLTFYASFLSVYAGTYTSHILVGLLGLVAYLFLKQKKYIPAGLLVGFAVACEYPLGILIPVWALVIYLNEKKISKPLQFAAATLPGILIVLLYNHHLTGEFFNTSYSYAVFKAKEVHREIGYFKLPAFSALWGLIFSTYRGVLYYTPVLIFIIWYAVKYGYPYLKASGKMQLLKNGIKNYLFITIVTYLILYSTYSFWDGGWAYGPRFLIPMVVIVLYEGIVFLASKPFSSYVFYALAAAGLLVTWMDKSTKLFEIPDKRAISNPVTDIIIPDFFKHKFNANTLPVFLFDANPVISVYLWPLLFIVGVIVLARWYAKLYPQAKTKNTLAVSVVPVLLFYMVIMAFQLTGGRNNLQMNTDGIFGAWPHFDKGFNLLGDGYRSDDQFIKARYNYNALSEFKKASQLAPTFEDAYFYTGVGFANQNMPDSAIHAFNKTIKLNPKYPLAGKMIGLAYINKKQYDSAIYYFTYAFQCDSDLGELMALGVTYQQVKNYPMAQHYDSLVLKYAPGDQATLHNLSIMQEEMKK